MTSKKWRMGAVALAVFAVGLTGCAGGGGNPAPSEPAGAGNVRQGGDLIVGLGAETNVLDPTSATEAVSRQILWNMCDRMYDVDDDGVLVPMLAQALPEFSDDAKSATISVKPDLKFQDGTPLDAEAVKASLDRYGAHPQSARTGFMVVYDSVEVVDDLTVKITMKVPYTPLTAELADYTGIMISPTAFEAAGDAFGENPVCVGPYTLESRVAGTETKLKRAEVYHDLENQAKVDTITYRVIRDPSARVANLESGDVHIATGIAAIDRQRIADGADTDLIEVDGLGYYGLSINLHNTNGFTGPFGDVDTPLARHPELREAFELSIDRELFNQAVFNGVQTPGCTPFGTAHPYYREIECAPHDVERAKELVEQSGVETPIPVRLLVLNTTEQIRYAEVIQQMAGEVGFEVTVDTADNVTTAQAGRAGDQDVQATGWTGRYDPDSTFAATIRTGGLFNYSGFNDPEIDAMLDEAASLTDMDERADIYYDIIERFREERAFIYLYTPRDSMAYRTEVFPGRLMSNATPIFRGAGFLE